MISIVILSYNTKDTTLNCLDQLYKSEGVSLETIVVDNASSDGSAEAIAKQFPQVKLMRNAENVGFAAGNNQGMTQATGETLLLLNSDCFVRPDTLLKSLNGLNDYDLLGCQLLNGDGSIQPSWGYFPTLFRIFLLMSFIDNFPLIRKFVYSIHVRDTARYDKTQEVDWVTGAFTLLKREVFEKVGGIDEHYFMYGEEMEWMYRIKMSGFKIGYIANAKATHLGGVSTKSDAIRLASALKGYMYWYKKHNPSWQLPILKFILVSGTMYKALAWSILGKLLGKPTWGKDNWETFKDISKASA